MVKVKNFYFNFLTLNKGETNMSINVSQIKNDFNSVKMENYEQAGNVVAKNFSDAEDLVMQTYTVKEEDDIKRLANDLGITVTYNKDEKGNNTTLNKDKTLEQIQTVAKLKYEKASRIYSMFTKIMENAHQMLMQIINKIG